MAEALLDYRALDGPLQGLQDAPGWYVGFSGGVDSTVLLHLMQRWCKANLDSPALSAVHINHRMQPAANEWQLHCEWLCKFLQIPIISRHVDVQPQGRGSEAAARAARYRIFEEQLGRGDILFLAHHLDDQVETFFLRLMRGAGVHGLAAIPDRRPLGEGELVRPLLHTGRSELENYARHHGLECVTDPTNSDSAMDRNFLRNDLLPRVAARWPGYRLTVARASEHMAGAVAALQQALPAPDTVYSVLGDPGVAIAELLEVPAEGAAVKLRAWLLGVGCLAPDQALLDEFLRQLRVAAADANPRLACGTYSLQRFRDAVYLLPAPDAPRCADTFTLAPGEIYEVPGVGRLGLEPAAEGFLLAPGERLEVTWRQGGERCKPRGRAAGSSLKKLLQEWQVPPWWRDRVPLLCLDGELLAVGDLWACDCSRWRDKAPRGEQLWSVRWERQTAVTRP